MKKTIANGELLKSLFIAAIIFLSSIFNASAQKIMTLDEGLVANSEMMPVKLKGGTGMMKYLFGEFAVISTKNKDNKVKNLESRDTIDSSHEWTLSRYKEEIWGKSEAQQNFVFLGNQSDTVLVNMTTLFNFNSTLYSENQASSREEINIIKNSNERFVAFLTPTGDMPSWVVEMDTQLGKEVKAPGGIICEGEMTDGSAKIEIQSVRQWSNGKSSKLFPILGFQLVKDGTCLAAVQASRNAGSKKYVWIRNDLPKELQLVLASATTTLMAMVDAQVSRL